MGGDPLNHVSKVQVLGAHPPSSAEGLQFFVPVQDSPPPRSKTPEPLPPSDDELRQVHFPHFVRSFFSLPKKTGWWNDSTGFFLEFSQFYWLGEMIQFHPIFQMGLVKPPAGLGWSQVEFPSLGHGCSKAMMCLMIWSYVIEPALKPGAPNPQSKILTSVTSDFCDVTW